MTRKNRIAQDLAHAWARNLRLGNPYAKFILCMLTHYVNGEGECFVGIKHLAADCDLHPQTVRARLVWLEENGIIRRTPQWIDEGGWRNSQRRGRQTTDLITLLIDGVEDYSAEFADDVGGDAVAPPDDAGESVKSPPGDDLGRSPDSLNKNRNQSARARSRGGPRAPARVTVEGGADPFDFVCHGTRFWRALVALDPEHMAKVPIRYGVGAHAAHTGWWFRRSLIQRALANARSTGPPAAESEHGENPADEARDDDTQHRELAASL